MQTARNTVIEALDLARVGEIGHARRLLHSLRRQNGCEADAFYGLGLVEWCQNNSDYAEAYYRKAIQLEPSHADAYYQLAKIADSRGDPVSASVYLKSALAQNPGHVLAAEALADHDLELYGAAAGRSHAVQ